VNDKELADALVALGIGSKVICEAETFYWIIREEDFVGAATFVRDWRVAGAVMEKMDGELLIWRINYEDENLEGGELISLQTGHAWVVEPPRVKDSRQNDSLPRAIIEAGVEALETDNE